LLASVLVKVIILVAIESEQSIDDVKQWWKVDRKRERERVSDCVDGVCLVINVSVLCLVRAYRKSYMRN